MARPKKQKKRTAAERVEDAKKALELHREHGMSVRDIAVELKLKPTTVFNDIKSAVAEAKEANRDYIEKHFKESVETLQLAESEALDAWYESLEDAEKRKTIKRKGDQSFEQTVKEIIGQNGDASYLKIIVSIQIAKAKLFESMSIKKSEQNLWQKVYAQIMNRNTKPQ